MREWLARLRDWLRRDTLDRELTEELRFHQTQLERDARDSGVPGDETHFTASRRLGNLTRVHEEGRDRWSWPWQDHFQQDGGGAAGSAVDSAASFPAVGA